MLLYALTIFTSSFLIFLVQPLLAKQILPWFGGSAAVWAICLVFFQFLLFTGYAYADWTTRRLSERSQWAIHVMLILASLCVLPIIPDAHWKPAGKENPTWYIFGLLSFTIGLPYFLLATTGPLVQSWCAKKFPRAPVYHLFALSNFAALLALISYPVFIEPWVGALRQSLAWSAGYGIYIILCCLAISSSLNWRLKAHSKTETKVQEASISPEQEPSLREHGAWLLLSAMGSFMLLAITNHLTQELTPVPFLWVLPLGIYLITFILCFEGRQHYQRNSFIWLVILAVGALAWKLNSWELSSPVAILLNSVGLFILCMFFHGELAERKPSSCYLTRFYLMVSLGGALGGSLVALVSVWVFNGYYEFGIGLLITLIIAAWVTRRLRPLMPIAAAGALLFSAYQIQGYIGYLKQNSALLARNFYGTLRVEDVDSGEKMEGRRRLWHGATIHGEQYISPSRQNETTTYYGPTSGVGRAIESMVFPNRRIGIVGMGIGTLASYGRQGDVYRFYELNPEVIQLAHESFTVLSNSHGKIEEVIGDARLTLEAEPPQDFDVLVIDAFSSDAIPVHLITREALQLYLRHTKSNGIIAFHVSNRYLRLAPVIQRLADDQGLKVAQVLDQDVSTPYFPSHWVLVARDPKQLRHPNIAPVSTPIESISGLDVWTDDANNLFQVLKMEEFKHAIFQMSQ